MIFFIFFIATRALQNAVGVTREITVFDRFVPHLLGVLNVGFLADILIPTSTPIDLFQRIANFCGLVLVYGSSAKFCLLYYQSKISGFANRALSPIFYWLPVSPISVLAILIACTPYYGKAYPYLIVFGGFVALIICAFRWNNLFGFFSIAVISDGLKMFSVDFLPASRISILYVAFVLGSELLRRMSQLQEDVRSQAAIGVALQVAHDIRAPIGTLKHVSPLLSGDSEVKAMLDASVGRISRIANDLLSSAKLGGRDSNRKQKIEIGSVLERLVEEHRIGFEPKKFELTLQKVPTQVFADVDLAVFERLISNLIMNAIEACPDQRGRVQILCAVDGRVIKVEIRDNGRGFSERVLDMLSRESIARLETTKDSGTGLGLLYAKRILNSWGGRLLVRSTQGQGSTVTVELPTATSI